MSGGPMQWTPDGMVSALTSAASAGTIGAAVPAVTTHDDEDDVFEAPVAQQPIARPVPAPKKTPPAPITPRNILSEARKRLREVKSELRRLRRLERERDELERLIDAATNKPRAIVRELHKRSAG